MYLSIYIFKKVTCNKTFSASAFCFEWLLIKLSDIFVRVDEGEGLGQGHTGDKGARVKTKQNWRGGRVGWVLAMEGLD